MDIQLNLSACEGHGLCAQAAPGLYELDGDGYVRLRATEILPETEAAATAGARVCPVAAIKIVN